MVTRAPPTNLPPETTSFVGRGDDLAALAAAFGGGGRLVTVLGPAGTGKTRVARRFAADQLGAGACPGGAWFCDLSEARTLEDVVAAVGGVIGAPPGRGDAPAQIGHALAGRGALLLVLDNFEQLVACGPSTIGRWLAAAPRARVLVTSRERLSIDGEIALELPPLAPELAARLFEERARAVRRDFAIGAADRADVAELVRRLDGLPLAIELAAARINVLPPKKLLERLASRFELLRSARRDRGKRQLTLRGAIDWSWDLLSPPERRALARCSVFRGGFDVEAAEAVLSPAAPSTAVDLVEALIDRSLVRRLATPSLPGEARFGTYESIREYAAEALEAMGDRDEVVELHATHYLGRGEAWAKGLTGPDVAECLARLRLETDNLLAAHRASLARAPAVAARIALALDAMLANRGPFELELELLENAVRAAPSDDAALSARALQARGQAWRARGDRTKGRADLDRALDLASRSSDPTLEAAVLAALARDELDAGHPEAARERVERALELAAGTGDRVLQAGLLGFCGQLQLKHNRLNEAREHFEAALALHREVGNRMAECATLGNLGIIDQWQWREEQAADDYRRALALACELGDRREEAVIRTNLALLHADGGQFEAAREQFEAALSVQREAGYRQFVGMSIGGLGTVDHAEGRRDEARRRYLESLATFRELGSRRYEIASLRYLGVLALDEGDAAAALTLLEEALAIAREVRDLSGFVLGPYGATLAALGRTGDARAAFDAAAADLAPRGEPRALAILALFEGFLDVARAREAEARGDPASANELRAAAQRRLDPGGPGAAATRSSDARLAAQLLERALGVAPAPSPAVASAPAPAAAARTGAPSLDVGPDLMWFEAPAGGRVDLGQRRALRLLLGRLIGAAREAPGRGVSVHELVEAGWPGERILPEAALSRVYTSIKTLRRLGLHELLVRRDDGYLLDPAIRVVVHPS